MIKKNPVEFFDDWAKSNKDKGMELNHLTSVNEMLKLCLPKSQSFTFLDAGCGNGWVVNHVDNVLNCISASGVDGSKSMIKKAKSNFPNISFSLSDINQWSPTESVDIVFSMEVIYYLKDPRQFVKNIYTKWLNKKGVFICGLDFYFENQLSHDWPQKYGINIMNLLNEKEWLDMFAEYFGKKIEIFKVNSKNSLPGTLVFVCKK